MEERKDTKTTPGAEGVRPGEARDAEATSGETLGDLEATTKVKGGRGDATAGESGSASSVPAPDGASGEGRGETADSRTSGDPM